MPEDYGIGYIWDPVNGYVPKFYQPSEDELARQQLESLVRDTYDKRENKSRQRKEARKELASTPTTTYAVSPSATSFAAFGNQVPRTESTVGKEAAVAGAALASPALFSPAALNFATNMAIGLPAFEVADKIPTLWGDDRATVQGGNLLESGFRAIYPDRWKEYEDRYAPYFNQAGMVLAGLPVGASGEILSRGAARGIGNALARSAARSAASRAGYFEPVAEMMAGRPSDMRASTRLAGEGDIRALMENGEFSPMDLDVRPVGARGRAREDLVRDSNGNVLRTPEGRAIRRGTRYFHDANGNVLESEYLYDFAGNEYDSIAEATGRTTEQLPYVNPATGEVSYSARPAHRTMTPEEQQVLRDQIQQRVNETLDRMGASRARRSTEPDLDELAAEMLSAERAASTREGLAASESVPEFDLDAFENLTTNPTTGEIVRIPEPARPVVYPARIGDLSGMRGRAYVRLADALGVPAEDLHADMDLSGINRRNLMDAANIADVRRGQLNDGFNSGDDGYLDVDALVNRLREQVRTSARNEMDDYIRSLNGMSYDELAASRVPDAWLDANYGLPQSEHVDYHDPAFRARYDRMREIERRGDNARASLNSLRASIRNMDEQEAVHLIEVLNDRSGRNALLSNEYALNVDDLNVGRRNANVPEVDVDDALHDILDEAIVRRDALVDARMNAAAHSSTSSSGAPLPTDRISQIVDLMNRGADAEGLVGPGGFGEDLDELMQAFDRAGINPTDTSNPYVRAAVNRIKRDRGHSTMQGLVLDYGKRFGLLGNSDFSSDYLNSYVRDYTKKAASRDIIDNFINPNGHNSIITIKDIRDNYGNIKQIIEDGLSSMPEGADPYEYLGNIPAIKNLAERIASKQWLRSVDAGMSKESAALSKYLTEKASAALGDNVAESEFYAANPNIRAYRSEATAPGGRDILRAAAEKEMLEEMAQARGFQHFDADVLLDPFHHDYLALSRELRGADEGAKILPGDVLHQFWFQGRDAMNRLNNIRSAVSSMANPTRQQRQLYRRLEDIANAQVKLAHDQAGRQSEWLFRDIPRGGGSGEANTSPDSYRVQIATAKRNWGDEPGKVKLIDTGRTVHGNNSQNDNMRVVEENGKLVLKFNKPENYRTLVDRRNGVKEWADLVNQEGLNDLVTRVRNGENLFDIVNNDPRAKETLGQILEALSRQKTGTFSGTNQSLKQINAKYGQNLRLIPDQSYAIPEDIGDRSAYSNELLSALRGLLNGNNIAPYMNRPYYISVKQKYGGLISRLQKHYGSNDKVLEAVRKMRAGGPEGKGDVDFVGPPVPYSLVTAGDIPMPEYNIFEDATSYGRRDAHLKSLDAFIKANPTVSGLNTADFRDVLSAFAGLESSYKKDAANKSGYSGYYGLKGGSALAEDAQHRKAYEHLASLFKHSITRDDIQKGIDMGYTPAQILYKYWNQGNNATEFLQNGSAATIGNNPGLDIMGNNISAIADYYKYIPDAVMDDFHVVKSGDNFSTIQERVRKPGRHYNQAGKDLKQWNTDDIVNGKLRIGDKVWFTTPYEDGGLLLTDYRSGGKIHIKPENRGKFTALKKRTGHSASWFKAHGTPAQKKMAVFALNAKKWKHADGGIIDRLNQHTGGDTAKMLELIRTARKG